MIVPDGCPRATWAISSHNLSQSRGIIMAERPASAHYRSAGWFHPHAFIEILRIANAIGNAAAQSSAMNQNARGPNAP